MEIDIELLKEILTEIEELMAAYDDSYKGRDVEGILRDGDMPKVYYDLKNKIEAKQISLATTKR